LSPEDAEYAAVWPVCFRFLIIFSIFAAFRRSPCAKVTALAKSRSLLFTTSNSIAVIILLISDERIFSFKDNNAILSA
jgi:hypothetical protein